MEINKTVAIKGFETSVASKLAKQLSARLCVQRIWK